MLEIETTLLLLLGVMIAGALFLAFRHFFSAQAREARRRTRNYRQVISRKRGPTVKLAVDLNENERKKKG